MAISYSNFLEISITASLMIAAILLFRVIFKRAPRWVFCLMWGIVALRLVLPVSLESRFSLLPEKEVISMRISTDVLAQLDAKAAEFDSDSKRHLHAKGRFVLLHTEAVKPHLREILRCDALHLL